MQSALLARPPADIPPLSFAQAVERVMQEKSAAFAFCPYTDEAAGRTDDPFANANIYVLICCRQHGAWPDADPDCWLHHLGGRYYGTATPPRERYRPEQVPLEAKLATYRLLPELNEAVLRGKLWAVHRVLLLLAEARERMPL